MSRLFCTFTALSLVSAASLGFSSEAKAQVNLPFLEDWEATNGETYTAAAATLAGAPEWSYSLSGTGGRLRLAAGAGFYNDGNHAATLDRAPSGTVIINYLTLTLNMTNYSVPQDSVVLDFAHMQHGDETSPNDRVWVRGSSADPYIEIYNLTVGGPAAGVYQQVQDVDITTALAGAGQQFSPTFQLRFGQEDDFDATAPNTTDGRSFDSIIVRRVLTNDMALQAVSTPADQSCGQTMHDVTVTVLNAGAASQSNIPVQVTITGDINQSFMGTVPGPVTKNQTASLVLGQINTYPGVNINIDAEVMLATDEDTGNDMLAVSRFIKPTEIIVAPPATVCPGESATIAVQPEPLASFELYDNDIGGTPLDTGDMLVTPPVDMMTTFWVERINATLAGGAVDNTIGMGGPYGSFDDGLVFSVTNPVLIQSVSAYPSSSGAIQIQILNGSNTVVGTSPLFQVVAADVNNKTEIPVGISLPIGSSYKMVATGTTTALFRNSDGAAYPYNISSWVNITGPTTNLMGAYYFFYDWQVSENVPVCSSERTPVDVDVDAGLCSADVMVTVDGPATADPGETIDYVTTVTNNGPNSAVGATVDLPTPNGLTFVSNTGDCTNAFPCDLGDLPSGAVATITSSFKVNDDFEGTAMLTATGSSGSAEGNPGDESDTVMTIVMNTAGVGGAGGGATGSGGATSSSAGGATGSGTGGGDPADDGGCSCRSAGGSSEDNGLALFVGMAGLALAGAVRRRRRRD